VDLHEDLRRPRLRSRSFGESEGIESMELADDKHTGWPPATSIVSLTSLSLYSRIVIQVVASHHNLTRLYTADRGLSEIRNLAFRA
jgi:hypothetical protein